MLAQAQKTADAQIPESEANRLELLKNNDKTIAYEEMDLRIILAGMYDGREKIAQARCVRRLGRVLGKPANQIC
jgi:hypothetical protein